MFKYISLCIQIILENANNGEKVIHLGGKITAGFYHSFQRNNI